MAIRNDISIDWLLSPRVITISLSGGNPDELVLQDLVDTITDQEDVLKNLTYPHIISAAGKEDLGGGVSVGITCTLLNAQVKFAPRITEISSGTITTQDTDGLILTDSGATFLADGVGRGYLIINETDSSVATVYTTDYEYQITTDGLRGGVDNQFDISDVYSVYKVDVCNITGGNLVAVDSIGATMNPIFPSFGTQVILASSSSSTLQDISAIQYASYQNAVWVDMSSSNTGTEYPVGTRESPVNNVQDAIAIGANKGLSIISVLGNLTLGVGDNVENIEIIGESAIKTLITINPSALVTGTEFKNASITGTLDGGNIVQHCAIRALNYVEGHIEHCLLEDYTITLGGTTQAIFLNCWSGVTGGTTTPIIDCGGAGRNLGIRGWHGGLKIANKTDTDVIIDMDSGRITVDSTVTGGTIRIRGVGFVEDNSTGTAVVVDDTLSSDVIVSSIFKESLSSYSAEGSFGKSMQCILHDNEVAYNSTSGNTGTTFPTGTHCKPVNNITDALSIMNTRKISKLMLYNSVIIGATDDVSNMAIETLGIMGTDITLTSGCIVNNTVFRHVNLQGTISDTDQLLVESCQIMNLSNFTGIMNNVAFRQGSEISVGTWATVILGTAGGEPTNEVEIAIGTGSLSLSNWTGNLKLKGKTGTNRTSINCTSGNIIIDSTCIAGTIQILGAGMIEADNSGPGCTVDTDGFVTIENISDAIWEESAADHVDPLTMGGELNIATSIVGRGTVQSATLNTIILALSANSNNLFYDYQICVITEGLGVGQSRILRNYNGASKQATVYPDWVVTPNNTSDYNIYTSSIAGIVEESFTDNAISERVLDDSAIDKAAFDRPRGIVQLDGSNSALIFKTNLSEVDDNYWKDSLLVFTSGSLINQVKKITAYDAASKFITVLGGYTDVPVAGDTFDLISY